MDNRKNHEATTSFGEVMRTAGIPTQQQYNKSEPATEADKQVVQVLLDTLKANQDRCVGMAANMRE